MQCIIIGRPRVNRPLQNFFALELREFQTLGLKDYRGRLRLPISPTHQGNKSDTLLIAKDYVIVTKTINLGTEPQVENLFLYIIIQLSL